MRTLVFFLFVALTTNLLAQHAPVSAKDVDHFYTTKTYVVMDDNDLSDYNFKVQDAVKNHWKVTPYEFIKQTEFENLRKDKNNSFLILSEVVFYKDKLQAKYDFFSLVLGGNYPTLGKMPVLAAVPLAYSAAPQESSAYKLGALLKFLQAHVELIKQHPELIDNDNMFKYYNDSQISLMDKTLYLIKEEQPYNLNTEAKIKALYPYKIKFVTRTELEDAIDNNEEDIVFLHKVGPEGTKRKARCFKIIVGTDSQLYYFDWHMITAKKPDGLLENDYKKIAKFDKKKN